MPDVPTAAIIDRSKTLGTGFAAVWLGKAEASSDFRIPAWFGPKGPVWDRSGGTEEVKAGFAASISP